MLDLKCVYLNPEFGPFVPEYCVNYIIHLTFSLICKNSSAEGLFSLFKYSLRCFIKLQI
jgi:hypothetical protein